MLLLSVTGGVTLLLADSLPPPLQPATVKLAVTNNGVIAFLKSNCINIPLFYFMLAICITNNCSRMQQYINANDLLKYRE
jgi:hypothetical protein